MGVVRVAYLGPAGTYSHKVARTRFGDEGEYLPRPTVDDAIRCVIDGEAEFCIVPMENSSGGTVYDTVDVLVDRDFPHERVGIREELSINVKLALVAPEGEAEIETVYSHFAPLKHCGEWLSANYPGATLRPVESTAAAAREASERKHAAAIASREAAKTYGLKILHYPVAEGVTNVTQFIGIGARDAGVTGASKTSIAFELLNKVGSLYEFLGGFAGNSINLTRIISRPIRGEPGKYVFLVDFEGVPEQPAAAAGLKEAEKLSTSLRNLGSYPVRETDESSGLSGRAVSSSRESPPRPSCPVIAGQIASGRANYRGKPQSGKGLQPPPTSPCGDELRQTQDFV